MMHKIVSLFVVFLVTILLGGCAQKVPIERAEPLRVSKPPASPSSIILLQGEEHESGEIQNRFIPTPLPVESSPLSIASPGVDTVTLTGPPVDVNFLGLPLPSFINEVYGNILQVSFEIDATLQNKKDLVTLRTSEPQTPAELDALSRQVLENYGVAVIPQGDLLRFTVSKNVIGEPPLLYSGRSLPEVPISHRPVFQLVSLHVVRNVNVKSWLNQAFKGQSLDIHEDPERNAILLKGTPDLVEQALAAIHILDQPYMRGRQSVRFEPLYLEADELANLLVDVLNTEGYSASLKPPMGSIIILPVNAVNAVLFFAAEPAILNHVKEWAANLDQPGRQSGEKKIFSYNVQNTSAVELGKVLNSVLSGMKILSQEGGLIKGKAGVEGKEGSTGIARKQAISVDLSSRLVVDEFRNSLIFRGNATEWQDVMALIKNMDQPSRQVLIEVTIANVTLSEETELGVEWLVKGIDFGGDYDGIAQTLGGLGIGSRGFSWTLDSAGQTRAILNAFASDNRVNILSTPRIMVKSGMKAKIDIGNDVPIITSQQSSSELSEGGNTGILQTIEYRKTGILLSVKPVVYSGNRVDLEVSQEVSEVSSQKQSEVESPEILTRLIETSLSLKDGGSVLLGGLIQSTKTTDVVGVPLLMDIPWLGQIFRVNTDSERRTELMMLIVPYVIDNHEDARAVTEAMKEQMTMQ